MISWQHIINAYFAVHVKRFIVRFCFVVANANNFLPCFCHLIFFKNVCNIKTIQISQPKVSWDLEAGTGSQMSLIIFILLLHVWDNFDFPSSIMMRIPSRTWTCAQIQDKIQCSVPAHWDWIKLSFWLIVVYAGCLICYNEELHKFVSGPDVFLVTGVKDLLSL